VSKFKNKYLNELEQFQGINPSAENICRWIYEEMKKSIPCDLKISRVVLWETPRYCAIYSDGMEQE
jgi:6-pyruvoyltetrahydropterin/6-carboxytetrahydropterin synthase